MTDTENFELTPELRILEAVLFASAEPLSTAVLAEQFSDEINVRDALNTLKRHYAFRGVNLMETDGHWSFRTAADLARELKITRQPRRKLPRAAAEVLAIIAYHQPITRTEVESIRGVETSRGTLDILLEIGWVRPGRRRDTPGRPLTWTTTPEFLSHFNLEALRDLPGMDELKAAGLLDTRPVLATLPSETESLDAPDEDDEFAVWVAKEPEAEAAE
jgi:segregation and condensation protein B